MAPHHHHHDHQQQRKFQKFKDNSVKRLPYHKEMEKKFNYTIKLANSLKRRAMNTPQNSLARLTKRKLTFSYATKSEKLQRPQAKRLRNNATIEEGEIIEEIESSDDDCIVLDPIVERISILDDSSDNESISVKSNITNTENADDNIPSTSSGFVIDRIGQCGLAWTTNTSPASPEAVDQPTTTSRLKEITSTTEIAKTEDNSEAFDDSVIFVKESKPTEDYIPLIAKGTIILHPNRKRVKKDNDAKGNTTPKIIKRMNESLFTTTERKKLDNYNSNTYNPGTAVTITRTAIANKRSIIIDGSNVAFAHGLNVFSVEGIKYCLDYFEKMGHYVKAVVPSFRRNQHKSSNPELLDQLLKDKKIVLTPCKNILNQQSSCYDDRFILQLAYERNAAIVSNDNYRDLVHENPAFKKIIQNRVIGYSWCDDILILPKDPYGRFGPHLDEILRC